MFELIAFAKFCRHLPLEEIAKLYKRLGLDGIELPIRYPDKLLTPDQAPTKLPEAAGMFADQGLTTPRMVTHVTRPDDEAKLVLEGCQKAGIEEIRLGPWVVKEDDDARQVLDQARSDLADLQPLLEQHGVRGAVQTHYGPELNSNASACLLMVEHCDPKWLGVQLDTGHQALGGAKFDLAVDLLGPYLHHINLKGSRWEFVADPQTNELATASAVMPLRDGACDFRSAMRKIHSINHQSPLSIHAEYRAPHYHIEKDFEATSQLLAEDVKYARRLMSEECV